MPRDPILDILKKAQAAADATRKAQNLPAQRTIGARAQQIGLPPGREQTGAEKVADFVSSGGTSKVINAIDRARLGDFSGMARQAGSAVKTAGELALFQEGMGAAKGAAAKFVGGLGKEAAMTMADLPERYAIMSGENPGGVMGAPATAGGNSQLAADARALGKKVTPVNGAYIDDKTGQLLHENSLLIHNIGQSDATALAQKHGQNSYVSQKGLHDLASGNLYPSKGVAATSDVPFTELPGGQKFAHDIDWNNPVTPQHSQSADMVKQLMAQGPIFGEKDLAASKAGDQLGQGTGPELPGAMADSVGSRAGNLAFGRATMPYILNGQPNKLQRFMGSLRTGTVKQMVNGEDSFPQRVKGAFGELFNGPDGEASAVPKASGAAGPSTLANMLKNMQESGFASGVPNTGVMLPTSGAGRAGTTTAAMAAARQSTDPNTFRAMVNAEIARRGGASTPEVTMAATEQVARNLASQPPKDLAAAELPKPSADSVVARTVQSMVKPGIPGLTKTAIPSAVADARTPAEVRANAKRAWAAANAPVEPQPTPRGLLVDRSQIQPLEGASTAPLPTREAPGPRASTGQLKGVGSDEANAINQAFVKRGLKMMPNTFYPSAKAFFESMGNAGGDPKLLRQATSAAAISNSVPGELIGGTAMNWAIKQGITSPEEIAAAKSLGDAQKIAARIRGEYNKKFGSGQGANDVQLMGSHVQALGQMLRGEEGGAYKIPTYDTQKGDPTATGSVLDRHGAKAQAVVSPFNPPASYSNAEYGLVEPVNRGNATEMGLPDSGYQEAQWRGGGLFTGLKSPPNQDYAQIGENAILEHARLTNQSPQAAQRAIATGQQALFNLPAKAKSKMPSLFGDDY